jgi:hypothetical protein
VAILDYASACPFWSRTTKHAGCSSTDHGGGKRRVEDIGWKILNARSYYNGMKRKLIKTHKERWEQGLAALSKFRKRKRHCCPSRHHLEGKFKLGRWVNTQRYLKDDLSVERKKRLDRIGFVSLAVPNALRLRAFLDGPRRREAALQHICSPCQRGRNAMLSSCAAVLTATAASWRKTIQLRFSHAR